ncbi:Midasin [Diplonema papillatum]|nr:Midasin [Diplonema papillatum]
MSAKPGLFAGQARADGARRRQGISTTPLRAAVRRASKDGRAVGPDATTAPPAAATPPARKAAHSLSPAMRPFAAPRRAEDAAARRSTASRSAFGLAQTPPARPSFRGSVSALRKIPEPALDLKLSSNRLTTGSFRADSSVVTNAHTRHDSIGQASSRLASSSSFRSKDGQKPRTGSFPSHRQGGGYADGDPRTRLAAKDSQTSASSSPAGHSRRDAFAPKTARVGHDARTRETTGPQSARLPVADEPHTPSGSPAGHPRRDSIGSASTRLSTGAAPSRQSAHDAETRRDVTVDRRLDAQPSPSGSPVGHPRRDSVASASTRRLSTGAAASRQSAHDNEVRGGFTDRRRDSLTTSPSGSPVGHPRRDPTGSASTPRLSTGVAANRQSAHETEPRRDDRQTSPSGSPLMGEPRREPSTIRLTSTAVQPAADARKAAAWTKLTPKDSQSSESPPGSEPRRDAAPAGIRITSTAARGGAGGSITIQPRDGQGAGRGAPLPAGIRLTSTSAGKDGASAAPGKEPPAAARITSPAHRRDGGDSDLAGRHRIPGGYQAAGKEGHDTASNSHQQHPVATGGHSLASYKSAREREIQGMSPAGGSRHGIGILDSVEPGDTLKDKHPLGGAAAVASFAKQTETPGRPRRASEHTDRSMETSRVERGLRPSISPPSRLLANATAPKRVWVDNALCDSTRILDATAPKPPRGTSPGGAAVRAGSSSSSSTGGATAPPPRKSINEKYPVVPKAKSSVPSGSVKGLDTTMDSTMHSATTYNSTVTSHHQAQLTSPVARRVHNLQAANALRFIQKTLCLSKGITALTIKKLSRGEDISQLGVTAQTRTPKTRSDDEVAELRIAANVLLSAGIASVKLTFDELQRLKMLAAANAGKLEIADEPDFLRFSLGLAVGPKRVLQADSLQALHDLLLGLKPSDFPKIWSIGREGVYPTGVSWKTVVDDAVRMADASERKKDKPDVAADPPWGGGAPRVKDLREAIAARRNGPGRGAGDPWPAKAELPKLWMEFGAHPGSVTAVPGPCPESPVAVGLLLSSDEERAARGLFSRSASTAALVTHLLQCLAFHSRSSLILPVQSHLFAALREHDLLDWLCDPQGANLCSHGVSTLVFEVDPTIPGLLSTGVDKVVLSEQTLADDKDRLDDDEMYQHSGGPPNSLSGSLSRMSDLNDTADDHATQGKQLKGRTGKKQVDVSGVLGLREFVDSLRGQSMSSTVNSRDTETITELGSPERTAPLVILSVNPLQPVARALGYAARWGPTASNEPPRRANSDERYLSRDSVILGISRYVPDHPLQIPPALLAALRKEHALCSEAERMLSKSQTPAAEARPGDDHTPVLGMPFSAPLSRRKAALDARDLTFGPPAGAVVEAPLPPLRPSLASGSLSDQFLALVQHARANPPGPGGMQALLSQLFTRLSTVPAAAVAAARFDLLRFVLAHASFPALPRGAAAPRLNLSVPLDSKTRTSLSPTRTSPRSGTSDSDFDATLPMHVHRELSSNSGNSKQSPRRSSINVDLVRAAHRLADALLSARELDLDTPGPDPSASPQRLKAGSTRTGPFFIELLQVRAALLARQLIKNPGGKRGGDAQALLTCLETGRTDDGGDDRDSFLQASANRLVPVNSTAHNVAKLKENLVSACPLIIEGPTGLGKTACVQEACRQLGIPDSKIIRFNLSAGVDVEDVLGRLVLSSRESGLTPYTLAFTRGCVLVLDECNLAQESILSLIESSLDTGELRVNNKKLVRHPDFRLVITQNPHGGMFSGKRESLSHAFLSRFRAVQLEAMRPSEMVDIVATKLAEKNRLKNDRRSNIRGGVAPAIVKLHAVLSATLLQKGNPLTVFTIRDVLYLADAHLDEVLVRAWIVYCGRSASRPVQARSWEAVCEHLYHLIPPPMMRATSADRRGSCVRYESDGGYPDPTTLLPPLPSRFPGEGKIAHGDCVVTRRVLTLWQTLYAAKQADRPVMVLGGSGCGKSAAVRSFCYYYNEHTPPRAPRTVHVTENTDAAALVGQFQPASKASAMKEMQGGAHTSDHDLADCRREASTDDRDRYVDKGSRWSSGKSPVVWVDGPVTSAMRRGECLVLDDLFEAAPVVVERLNSVLEQHPQLLLSERDGRERVSADGNGFTIFSTGSYEAVANASPALANRFLVVQMEGSDASSLLEELRVLTKAFRPAFSERDASDVVSYLKAVCKETGDLRKVVRILKASLTVADVKEAVVTLFSQGDPASPQPQSQATQQQGLQAGGGGTRKFSFRSSTTSCAVVGGGMQVPPSLVPVLRSIDFCLQSRMPVLVLDPGAEWDIADRVFPAYDDDEDDRGIWQKRDPQQRQRRQHNHQHASPPEGAKDGLAAAPSEFGDSCVSLNCSVTFERPAANGASTDSPRGGGEGVDPLALSDALLTNPSLSPRSLRVPSVSSAVQANPLRRDTKLGACSPLLEPTPLSGNPAAADPLRWSSTSILAGTVKTPFDGQGSPRGSPAARYPKGASFDQPETGRAKQQQQRQPVLDTTMLSATAAGHKAAHAAGSSGDAAGHYRVVCSPSSLVDEWWEVALPKEDGTVSSVAGPLQKAFVLGKPVFLESVQRLPACELAELVALLDHFVWKGVHASAGFGVVASATLEDVRLLPKRFRLHFHEIVPPRPTERDYAFYMEEARIIDIDAPDAMVYSRQHSDSRKAASLMNFTAKKSPTGESRGLSRMYGSSSHRSLGQAKDMGSHLFAKGVKTRTIASSAVALATVEPVWMTVRTFRVITRRLSLLSVNVEAREKDREKESPFPDGKTSLGSIELPDMESTKADIMGPAAVKNFNLPRLARLSASGDTVSFKGWGLSAKIRRPAPNDGASVAAETAGLRTVLHRLPPPATDAITALGLACAAGETLILKGPSGYKSFVSELFFALVAVERTDIHLTCLTDDHDLIGTTHPFSPESFLQYAAEQRKLLRYRIPMVESGSAGTTGRSPNLQFEVPDPGMVGQATPAAGGDGGGGKVHPADPFFAQLAKREDEVKAFVRHRARAAAGGGAGGAGQSSTTVFSLKDGPLLDAIKRNKGVLLESGALASSKLYSSLSEVLVTRRYRASMYPGCGVSLPCRDTPIILVYTCGRNAVLPKEVRSLGTVFSCLPYSEDHVRTLLSHVIVGDEKDELVGAMLAINARLSLRAFMQWATFVNNYPCAKNARRAFAAGRDGSPDAESVGSSDSESDAGYSPSSPPAAWPRAGGRARSASPSPRGGSFSLKQPAGAEGVPALTDQQLVVAGYDMLFSGDPKKTDWGGKRAALRALLGEKWGEGSISIPLPSPPNLRDAVGGVPPQHMHWLIQSFWHVGRKGERPSDSIQAVLSEGCVLSRSLAENMARVLAASTLSIPLLLEGPPGIGKGFVIQEAARILGHHFIRVQMSGGVTVEHLFGTTIPLVKDGKPVLAFRKGVLSAALDVEGTVWILLDEFNLAPYEVQQALIPLLCGKKKAAAVIKQKQGATEGTSTPPKPGTPGKDTGNFRFFAAVNPVNTGGGRSHIPASLQDYFVSIMLSDLTQEEIAHVGAEKLKQTNIPTAFREEVLVVHQKVLSLYQARAIGDGDDPINIRTLEKVALLLVARTGKHAVPGEAIAPQVESQHTAQVAAFVLRVLDVVYRWRFSASADREQVAAIVAAHTPSLQRAAGAETPTEQPGKRSYSHASRAAPPQIRVENDLVCFDEVTVRRGSATVEGKALSYSAEMARRVRSLAVASSSSLAVLVEGPTAVGKTSLVKEFARLCARKLVILTMAPNTDGNSLTGRWLPYAVDYPASHISLANEILELAAGVHTPTVLSALPPAVEQLAQMCNRQKTHDESAMHRQPSANLAKNQAPRFRGRSANARALAAAQDSGGRRPRTSSAEDRHQYSPRGDGSDAASALVKSLSRALSNLCDAIAGSDAAKAREAIRLKSLACLSAATDSFVFRFEPSQLLRAVRNGEWVLLDNVDWAPQATIEQLNSLLEAVPSLQLYDVSGSEPVLTKGNGIHNDFRLFLTANPKRGHATRLSQALLNRVVRLCIDEFDPVDLVDLSPFEPPPAESSRHVSGQRSLHAYEDAFKIAVSFHSFAKQLASSSGAGFVVSSRSLIHGLETWRERGLSARALCSALLADHLPSVGGSHAGSNHANLEVMFMRFLRDCIAVVTGPKRMEFAGLLGARKLADSGANEDPVPLDNSTTNDWARLADDDKDPNPAAPPSASGPEPGGAAAALSNSASPPEPALQPHGSFSRAPPPMPTAGRKSQSPSRGQPPGTPRSHNSPGSPHSFTTDLPWTSNNGGQPSNATHAYQRALVQKELRRKQEASTVASTTAAAALKADVLVGISPDTHASEGSFLTTHDKEGMQFFGATLVSTWRSKAGGILEELLSNLVTAPSVDKVSIIVATCEELAPVLRSFPGLTLLELFVLKLYTMEGPDVDRLMGFREVPVYLKDPEGWKRYNEKYKGKRNAQVYTEVNRSLRVASLPDSGQEKVEAEGLFRKWIKVIGVLMGVASPLETAVQVQRGLKGLSKETVEQYASFEVGDFVGWASPSSTSRKGYDDTFLKDPTESVSFVIENVTRGVDLKLLSVYPEEEELLLPPFTGFIVESVCTPPETKYVTVRLNVVSYLCWEDGYLHAFLLQVNQDVRDAPRRLLRLSRLIDATLCSTQDDQLEKDPVGAAVSEDLAWDPSQWDFIRADLCEGPWARDDDLGAGSEHFFTMDSIRFTETSKTDRVFTPSGFVDRARMTVDAFKMGFHSCSTLYPSLSSMKQRAANEPGGLQGANETVKSGYDNISSSSVASRSPRSGRKSVHRASLPPLEAVSSGGTPRRRELPPNGSFEADAAPAPGSPQGGKDGFWEFLLASTRRSVKDTLTALENLFPPNVFTRNEASAHGASLYIPGLIRAIATNFTYNKVFCSKRGGGKRSYSVSIALDATHFHDLVADGRPKAAGHLPPHSPLLLSPQSQGSPSYPHRGTAESPDSSETAIAHLQLFLTLVLALEELGVNLSVVVYSGSRFCVVKTVDDRATEHYFAKALKAGLRQVAQGHAEDALKSTNTFASQHGAGRVGSPSSVVSSAMKSPEAPGKSALEAFVDDSEGTTGWEGACQLAVEQVGQDRVVFVVTAGDTPWGDSEVGQALCAAGNSNVRVIGVGSAIEVHSAFPTAISAEHHSLLPQCIQRVADGEARQPLATVFAPIPTINEPGRVDTMRKSLEHESVRLLREVEAVLADLDVKELQEVNAGKELTKAEKDLDTKVSRALKLGRGRQFVKLEAPTALEILQEFASGLRGMAVNRTRRREFLKVFGMTDDLMGPPAMPTMKYPALTKLGRVMQLSCQALTVFAELNEIRGPTEEEQCAAMRQEAADVLRKHERLINAMRREAGGITDKDVEEAQACRNLPRQDLACEKLLSQIFEVNSFRSLSHREVVRHLRRHHSRRELSEKQVSLLKKAPKIAFSPFYKVYRVAANWATTHLEWCEAKARVDAIHAEVAVIEDRYCEKEVSVVSMKPLKSRDLELGYKAFTNRGQALMLDLKKLTPAEADFVCSTYPRLKQVVAGRHYKTVDADMIPDVVLQGDQMFMFGYTHQPLTSLTYSQLKQITAFVGALRDARLHNFEPKYAFQEGCRFFSFTLRDSKDGNGYIEDLKRLVTWADRVLVDSDRAAGGNLLAVLRHGTREDKNKLLDSLLR